MPDSVSLHGFGFEPDKLSLAGKHNHSTSRDPSPDSEREEKQQTPRPSASCKKSSTEEGVGENIDLEA
jgi:hypothetical protein